MRYLDPKADLTFKRVFGEHHDIVISFLNALLPLKDDEHIVEIEYLSPEMVPENPLSKLSIVDVCCKDNFGRQFIVEMQMAWYSEFKQRVLFNASKAYVRQIGTGDDYKLLKPVYSLNLINEVFEPNLEGYYHHYRVVHVEHSDRVIDGLQLVFIELPKFNPNNLQEKKMRALWLRFLTEIGHKTREVSEELLAVPEVEKAVKTLREAAFSDAEIRGYEKFWDAVSVEKTIRRGSEEKGHQEGFAKGLEEGIEEGLKEGLKKGIKEGIKEGMVKGIEKALFITACKMKADNLSAEIIAQYTGLSIDEIETLV